MVPMRRMLVLCGLLMATAVFGAEKKYSETFSLNSGGELLVNLDVGNMKVETWNRNVVEFSAKVSGSSSFVEDFKFEYDSGDGNRVEINGTRSIKKRWGWNSGTQRVNATLKIPNVCNVKLKTSGGNIDLESVDGEVEVRTSGGNLAISNVKGSLLAKTSGGNIKVGAVQGNSRLSTSGGDIYLEELAGDLDAHTSGGNIVLDGVTGQVVAKTSGGNIRLTVTNPYQGIQASTSGGDIRCYVEGDLNADVSAKTSGGRVNIDFPVTIQGKISKSRVEGKINKGGPELNLRTSGGNISVLRAK